MEATNPAYKYIYAQNLMGKKSSVHSLSEFRFKRAEEQATLTPIDINEIVRLTNEFLRGFLGMKEMDEPLVAPPPKGKEDISKIKGVDVLRDVNDIVWMKFTKDGYLGVVAVSADINFDKPSSEKEYDAKNKEKPWEWKYNTSGIIVDYLNKEWEDSFILLFLLVNIPKELNRGDVECGIGNYLIERGVPILDYYSHRM